MRQPGKGRECCYLGLPRARSSPSSLHLLPRESHHSSPPFSSPLRGRTPAACLTRTGILHAVVSIPGRNHAGGQQGRRGWWWWCLVSGLLAPLDAHGGGCRSMGLAPAPSGDAGCPSCNCPRCCPPSAGGRSVKRKLYVMEVDEGEGNGGPGDPPLLAARVEAGDEVAVLREALAVLQQTVAQLCEELEEERAASASAASEAMSMILRLQREKGEVQMEARQFKRFAEEKMAHDQQELLSLEDLVYRREEAIQALSCEVLAYRHRLLSYGIALDGLEPAADGAALEGGDNEYGDLNCVYPQLRCYGNPHGLDLNLDRIEDGTYLEKCHPREVPAAGGQRGDLERTPSPMSLVNEMEKGVVMGQSPLRQLSTDSFGSLLSGEPVCSGKQHEEFHAVNRGGDDDNMSDRVYTIDAVHGGETAVSEVEDYVGTTRESVCRVDGPCGKEETDMKKLEMRLRALEADRESMIQALISMHTDKAQLVLLKEVAQHLCRDVSAPSASPPERKLVKIPSVRWCFSFVSMIKSILETSFLGRFSFKSTIKWVMSFVFRKKKTDQIKYMFERSNNNLGLLLLLDNAPRIRHLRFHSRVRGRPVRW